MFVYSGADGILAQAKDWEMKGEHSRAIDMYLKVSPNSSSDTRTLTAAWEKVNKLKDIFQSIYFQCNNSWHVCLGCGTGNEVCPKQS